MAKVWRLRALGVMLIVILCASACAQRSPASQSDGRPVVLTTFTVLQDMAMQVAGDHLDIRSITAPGEEIHDYQPSPDDIKQGIDADLIIANGLGLEGWFEKLTETSDAETVILSAGIEPIAVVEGEAKGQPNPHAWMSPKNALIYVDNLVLAFCELDPEHADEYRENGEEYKRQIAAISEEMERELAKVPEAKRALVTCEGAFSYLARDYGLTEHYLWAINSEGALTPRRVASVVDFVKDSGVPAVFCESTVEGKMNAIVEATSARYGGTLYVDSLTKADGAAPTYLELLRYDATTITQGLTRSGK